MNLSNQNTELKRAVILLEKIAPKLVLDPSCEVLGFRPGTKQILPVPFAGSDRLTSSPYLSEEDFWELVLRTGSGLYGVGCLLDFWNNLGDVPASCYGKSLVFAGVRLLSQSGLRFVLYAQQRVNPSTGDGSWVLDVHGTSSPYWLYKCCLVQGLPK